MSEAAVIWLLCGIIGVAVMCHKEPDMFKKADAVPVFVGLSCAILFGPLTLIKVFFPRFGS